MRSARAASEPTGTSRSLEPLPRARSSPASRSTSPTSSPIASDARRPQAYIVSSSARSRSAAGSGAARLGEQLGDLVAGEDLRQLAARLGRAQVRGRVGGQRAGAAQVAVEGAQAGDLALQRRGRRGRPVLAAGGELVGEGAQLGVADARAGPARCGAATRRTGAGRSGRPRACCATGRARTPGRRGSRAAGARTAALGAREEGRRPRSAGFAARRRRPCRRKAPFRPAGQRSSR